MTKKRFDDDDEPDVSDPPPSTPSAGGQQEFDPPPYSRNDPTPVPTHPGEYWPNLPTMLRDLAEHARTTHGLAADKELFTKLHAYLSHHLL